MARDITKQRACQREWQKRNREQINERTKHRIKAVQRKVQQLHTPCVDCGNLDIRFMDWHHKDPALKEQGISKMIRQGKPFDAIKTETDKCVSLCSNCHRIRHADEREQAETASTNTKSD